MKDIRLISLLLALSVLLTFSACSRSAEPTSPSKEQQSAQVQENQPTSESETENSADDSLQQQTNQDTKEEDFKLPSTSDTISFEQAKEFIQFLDALLLSEWETPQDIQPMNFVFWYGYQIMDSGTLEEYFLDGREGPFFPAEEFETKIRKYFDVSVEHLRSPSAIYLEDEQLYTPQAALMPLTERSYDITDIKQNGSVISIEFTLTYTELHKSKNVVLTLEKVSDGIRFLSFSRV